MWRKIKVFLEVIKIEHTVFSLPFAYVGGILATQGLPSLREWFWITLAVLGARSAGMAFNRLADRDFDACNPRSKHRALPEQRISVQEVIMGIKISLALLIFASWRLNPLCLLLLPVVVGIIFFYSCTKRFTWASHLFLGLCLGLAPVGSWIGIRGSVALDPILLGLGVMFWTAGFDIIYSTMDYQYDLSAGLFSIPVRFGLHKALQTSLVFHLISLIFFTLLKFVAGLGWYYLIALGVVGFLLFRENSLVSPEDLSKVNIAFFRINGLVSLAILLLTILDFQF